MYIDKWIDEVVVHIYNGMLFSHKKEPNWSFVEMWMDLESILWREISQKENKIVC